MDQSISFYLDKAIERKLAKNMQNKESKLTKEMEQKIKQDEELIVLQGLIAQADIPFNDGFNILAQNLAYQNTVDHEWKKGMLVCIYRIVMDIAKLCNEADEEVEEEVEQVATLPEPPKVSFKKQNKKSVAKIISEDEIDEDY